MKNLQKTILVLVTLTLAACGSDKNKPADSQGFYNQVPGAPVTLSSIYGLWGATETQGSVRHEIRILLQTNRMYATNRCTFADGRVETAQLDVSAVVTATEIRVLEERRVREPLGCEVHFQPTTYRAELRNGTLSLSNTQRRETITLNKIRD